MLGAFHRRKRVLTGRKRFLMTPRQGADLLSQCQQRLFVFGAEVRIRFALQYFNLLACRIEGRVPVELIVQGPASALKKSPSGVPNQKPSNAAVVTSGYCRI